MSTEFNLAIGISSIGKIKFSLKNKQIFDLAVAAFNKYSKYGNNVDNINYFLQTLQITSSLEAGFDGINTYDKAGISVGFIQFARPNQNVHKLLSLFNKPLADKVKAAFGTKDNYDDPKSLIARKNKTLISEVQRAIVTPQGIDAQFQLCIEDFYDNTFAKFLSLKFQPETFLSSLKMVQSTAGNEDQNKYKIYANAFIFDVGVNQGLGSRDKNGLYLQKIKQINIGSVLMTEGLFLQYHVNNIYLRPERKSFWNEVLNENFTTFSV